MSFRWVSGKLPAWPSLTFVMFLSLFKWQKCSCFYRRAVENTPHCICIYVYLSLFHRHTRARARHKRQVTGREYSAFLAMWRCTIHINCVLHTVIILGKIFTGFLPFFNRKRKPFPPFHWHSGAVLENSPLGRIVWKQWQNKLRDHCTINQNISGAVLFDVGQAVLAKAAGKLQRPCAVHFV